MATIRDVARIAGVSVATASNALNNTRGVKHSTKECVLAAARELHYTPNPMAKALVTGNSEAIGIVLSGPSTFNVLTNQSILQLIQSMARRINDAGYSVLLNMADFNKDRDIAHALRSNKHCDGLVLVDTRSSDSVVSAFLANLSIPALVAMRGCPTGTYTSICVDNLACGYIATRHVLEHGHRRIAYVGVLEGVGPAELRLQGYAKALAEYGLKREPGYCLRGDHYQESGREAALEFLRIQQERPSAIVAGNDLMALGVIEVLQREGLRVPEDVSIVGCDNLPNAHMLRVPLTSVAIPFEHMGVLAAQGILQKIKDAGARVESVVLQPELRARDSVRTMQ